jgi:hypothetical protein
MGDIWSEEWRHQCECKYVVSMKTLKQRRSYMALAANARSKAAYTKLFDGVKDLFFQEKEKALIAKNS